MAREPIGTHGGVKRQPTISLRVETAEQSFVTYEYHLFLAS